MKYQKGTILKFSEEGLNWLYAARVEASKWRFQYRCQSRNAPNCISVIKLGNFYYQRYHERFLEKV